MDFIKSVWGFLTNTLYLDSILAVLGGLAVLSKATKTTIDDKVLGYIVWPFKQLKDFLVKK